MEKERILIVEDDPNWVDNYKRWLRDEYLIDVSATAKGALEMLKTKYYALVLLDLSLSPTYHDDRTSEEVQIYLKNTAEGTKHIIISGHADKNDVRKASISYKAFDVFFKKDDFENLVPFLEAVKNAIVESKKERPNFTKEAYEVFCGVGDRNFIEFKIIQALKPEGGINGWFYLKENFFEAIAPVAYHSTRSNIAFEGNCILGLFWSRKLGQAVSICLASNDVKEEECLQTLDGWLGWRHSDGKKISLNNIQGHYFVETDLSPEDFNLSKKT